KVFFESIREKTMSPISIVLVIALFLPPQTFELIGTVRDDTGHAVPNVQVSLIDDNYQTVGTKFVDTTGRFRFTGVRQGRFVVRVETIGTDFEEHSENLDLQPISFRQGMEPMHFDIVLRRKAGTARGSSGSLFSQDVPEEARAQFQKGIEGLQKSKSDQA